MLMAISSAPDRALHHILTILTVLQEQERVRWEEQRKAMQQDAYQKQEVAKYQDQLARQRGEVEHEKQRQRNLELVRLQVPP